MLVRSKVRNVCANMKKGIRLDDYIIELVENKLPPAFSWSEYQSKWDVTVIDGDVFVLEAVTEDKILFETCAQKRFAVINNVEPKWNPQQQFIIETIELDWLEPKMNWQNYGEVWEASIDNKTKKLQARLLNIPYGQREIQDFELIPKETEKAPENHLPVSYVNLENVQPLTEEIKTALKSKGLLP